MRRNRKRKVPTFSGQFSRRDFAYAGLQDLSSFSVSNDIGPPVISSNAAAASTSQLVTSNEVIVIDDDDRNSVQTSDIDNSEYLGFLSGMIVGIRYYTGMVSNNEMVSLDREPHNPYDCNAVKVSNARGVKVGHIKKDMARALAKIVDPGLAHMEGIVLRRGGNPFTIPVIISIFGDPQKLDTISSELKKYGYALQTQHYSQSFNSDTTASPYSQPIVCKTTKLTSSQIKSQLDNLFQNLVELDETDEASQPQVVKSKLFKHQLQAVKWMIRKEKALELPAFWEKITSNDGSISYKNTISNFQTKEEPNRLRGGILADDMGLGKTLVVISLIVEHGKDSESIFKEKLTKEKKREKSLEEKLAKRSKKRPVKYNENQTCDDDIEKGHSAKPKKSKFEKGQILEDDDCIIIDECLESKPKLENIIFQKGVTQPTLIICPLSVISNWEGQIKEHLVPTAQLNVVVYHGSTKLSAPKLNQQDIVITTYQTLAHQFKKSKTAGALLKVKWLRVVLDEGHVIRNPTALQTQACCALKSERKWILSGTPIQNSINDLSPIFSFLGLEPFADRAWWKRTIERPLKNGEEVAMRRIQCLMGLICMRRTKHQRVNGKPIVDLPDKEICLTTIDLLPNEKLIYDKMDAFSKKTIKKLVDEGELMTKYAEVLVILMRLRQICCHTYLAKDAIEELNSDGSVPANEAKELVAKLVELLSSGSVEECCVCLDSLTTPVITRCAHIFCKTCITEVILSSSGVYSRCPLCRGSVNESELVEVPPEGSGGEVKGEEVMNPSSKIIALLDELRKIEKNDPKVKSLVVSQFTSFLKIIEKHLIKENIHCVIFYGGMSMAQRKEAINSFQHGKSQVMLLSLKAGGVGLNLTAASRVFLMDPAWNPAAEEQCFDRVHRLGQTKSVKVVKFICSNSIEERIVEVQKVKQKMAGKSLQKINSEQRKNQTLKDLRTLIDV